MKVAITKSTGYTFKEHPLQWAKDQIESSLLKTDTAFNDSLKRTTIYYYNKQGNLIQIVTTGTLGNQKLEWTKVFDEQNNLIFWENLTNRNTAMRIRRGYDEYNRLLFECKYFETPIAKLKIYPNEAKPIFYQKQVCDCDF